ncbi:MAG: type VI secretion system baseplate subunit TssG [Thermoanaerobaculia bacterium]
MAGETGWAEHPLARRLASEARQFSFFQAVHLIQASFPQAAPVGGLGPPAEECIRFRGDLSLAFPESDIQEISIEARPGSPGAFPRCAITTSFLGVYGTSSPLPAFYTEDLLQDDSDDSLVREFLDLFHHRLISLLYRVWGKYRYPLQFRPGGADLLSRRLLALSGLSPELIPGERRVPPVRLLAYIGLLTQLPRSASALRGVLADHFPQVRVEVEQCAGQRLAIPPGERNRLGRRNSRLGDDLSLGESVFDRSATFRIVLGPSELEVFLDFLPPGAGAARLRELVDLVNADALDYQIELRICREAIPELCLSSPTALLGWSTWLGRRPPLDQTVLLPVKGRSHGER